MSFHKHTSFVTKAEDILLHNINAIINVARAKRPFDGKNGRESALQIKRLPSILISLRHNGALAYETVSHDDSQVLSARHTTRTQRRFAHWNKAGSSSRVIARVIEHLLAKYRHQWSLRIADFVLWYARFVNRKKKKNEVIGYLVSRNANNPVALKSVEGGGGETERSIVLSSLRY